MVARKGFTEPLIGLILFLIVLIKAEQMTDQTTTISVVVGRPLIIKCIVENLKNITDIKLQWSKDMFGLENSTLTEVYKNRIFVPTTTSSGIFDLHFKSTEADDQGLYGCHVDITKKDGSMINIVEKTYLKIIIPPYNLELKPKISNSEESNILWLPIEKTIWGLQNYIVILKCNSSYSSPMTKIMWMISTEFGNSEINNLQSDMSAMVKLSHKIQNSTVSCIVRNKKDYLGVDLPSINYTIRVLYFSKPHIVCEDGKLDGQIREGELATFICKAEAPKEVNIYYSWFIRYSKKSSYDHHLVNDSTSNSITLTMSKKHHRGRIHCLLRATIQQNECDRQTNRDCKLELVKDIEEIRPFNILYPPKIANPFENVTVTNIGEWVTLKCNVDSNPPATIRWFKTHIGTTKNSRSINWYHQTKISNLIESLRIENIVISGSYHKFQMLNDQDFDIYICEAKSNIFENAYKYVIVAKEEEISIKTDRTTIKIQEGGSASLMCLIEGWPRPPSGSVEWHHADSPASLRFNEGMYVVNKNQLMAVESKLYFKNVVNSDYGSYNCSVRQGTKRISKRIYLQPIKDPIIIFTLIGVIGILFVIITAIVVIFVSRRLYDQKSTKNKKVTCNEYSPPIQVSMLPSPTMDSCMENELLYNRLNSFQDFHKENSCNESINVPQNLCFVYNNKHHVTRLPSGESRNGHDNTSNSKGNESNRSWDSGVGPDDAIYRNGQILPNTRGSRCISPFSTMASSNNSIGPANQINLGNNRYWQPTVPIEMNQQNIETNSNRFSNTDQGSTFNGSVHSSFIPSSIDGSVPLIASTGNQSFVCIPIEEYQHHIRLLQESRGPPSLHSFPSTSFSHNNESSTFNNNYKLFNDNVTPTENSVKLISTHSKP